jgi:hypothetical protein
MIEYWMAHLGDAYVLSWINTLLYGGSLVAACCKWNRLRQGRLSAGERHLWLFLIVVLFALGINKQLDFQTLFIEAGRRLAKYEGWYEKRRLVQAGFAYALSGIIGCGLLLILGSSRKLWRHHGAALIGLMILCLFTIIRTTSINHIMLVPPASSQGEFRPTDIVEFFGILAVLVNALACHENPLD